MDSQNKKKERRCYEPDFIAQILKMLVSGKKVSNIAETFGIAENLLYRWKTTSIMKTKVRASSPIAISNWL
ncbi:transposase [Arundinibacter roseus]|uniref:Transposase n=1 Tax=Arundinibacter roseus TaxID=2070510 RepID=A0A4R4JV41_9BACT|nr:transposase [Arundinibacter roseus]TDB57952.1 hypothetical protein EZE20_23445 [Arundinibacter roseus]